jgi:nicotinate-nucleotide pyrophosphorylase (carboxylating)
MSARRTPGPGEGALRFVEVEVDSLEQLKVILDAGGCGVDSILLDNMTTEQLSQAVKLRNESGAGIILEASGGVTLESVGKIAATGVDDISAGQLTHSAVSLDVALDIRAVS